MIDEPDPAADGAEGSADDPDAAEAEAAVRALWPALHDPKPRRSPRLRRSRRWTASS